MDSATILSALKAFKSYVCQLATCFRSVFDDKLFGTTIMEYLSDNNPKIIVTAAGRQSANDLLELHWKTMVHMSRIFLTETEKQMQGNFWYYAIKHATRMLNAIPGEYKGK